MMKDKTAGIKKYAQGKTKLTIEKAEKAIRSLSLKGENINFNSVAKEAGISKSFLYDHDEIKFRIERLRIQQIDSGIKQLKTDQTKDLIIKSKDKKMKELSNENKKLREELEFLRNEVYKTE